MDDEKLITVLKEFPDNTLAIRYSLPGGKVKVHIWDSDSDQDNWDSLADQLRKIRPEASLQSFMLKDKAGFTLYLRAPEKPLESKLSLNGPIVTINPRSAPSDHPG